jgi:hypothetical protein
VTLGRAVLPVFGITAIREFTNLTPAVFELYRVRTRELVKVAANGRVNCNVWIPWADTVKQFNAGEHIILRTAAIWLGGYYVFPKPYFWIWQQGDYVRFSTDGEYHINGDRVDGDSRVDGDRALEVSASGAVPAIRLRA